MLYVGLLLPLLGLGGALVYWGRKKCYTFQRPFVWLLVGLFLTTLVVNIIFWRDLPCYLRGGEVVETDSAMVTWQYHRRGIDRTAIEVRGQKLWGIGMPDSTWKTFHTMGQQENLCIRYLPYSGMLLEVTQRTIDNPEIPVLFESWGFGRCETQTVYSLRNTMGQWLLVAVIVAITVCLAAPFMIWHAQGKTEK